MLKFKFKNLILVFLALICLLPFATVSASAKDDHVYPCYCDECIQLWNKNYFDFLNNHNKTNYLSFLSSLNGFNEDFNGLYMFIGVFTEDSELTLIFCESFSIDISLDNSYPNYPYVDFDMKNQYILALPYGSVDLTSLSLESFRFFSSNGLCSYYASKTTLNSPYNDGFILYAPVNSSSLSLLVDSDMLFKDELVVSYFEHPLIISDTDVFKEEFPGFLKAAWSSIHDFIVNNELVLIVFAISLAGSIVAIVKRTSR